MMTRISRSFCCLTALCLTGLSFVLVLQAEEKPTVGSEGVGKAASAAKATKEESSEKADSGSKKESKEGEPKGKEASSTPADAAAKKWQPLFDGKSLDGWKITEFGTGGEIEVDKNAIQIGYGDGCTGITWTKEFPKVDYEVLVEAQRVDGSDFFCGLTFPVQESPCSLIVGGWGGALVGLSSIDGQDAANNDTKLYMTFKKKQWYQVRLRVTKTHISAWIDNERVIHQPTAGHKLTVRPEVEKSRPFGICSWCTTAAIRKADVRKLTKEEAEQVDAEKPTEKGAEKAKDE